MKFTAILLLCFIVFLSSFSGMFKPVRLIAGKTCCKRIAGKKVCHEKKAKNDDACTKPGCATLLTCSICGFIAEQRLSVIPGYLRFDLKPVSFYKIGKLSAYHKADWKPPEAC
jgi:hypothetical protein